MKLKEIISGTDYLKEIHFYVNSKNTLYKIPLLRNLLPTGVVGQAGVSRLPPRQQLPVTGLFILLKFCYSYFTAAAIDGPRRFSLYNTSCWFCFQLCNKSYDVGHEPQIWGQLYNLSSALLCFSSFAFLSGCVVIL